MGNIIPIYTQALKNIDSEIESIYRNYAKKGILTKADLSKALLPSEKELFLKKIRVKASNLGLDINDVYDERYLFRLTRLEALKQQIYFDIYQIPEKEQTISTKAYSKIIDTTYESTQKDIQNAGISISFATLDKSVAYQILNSKWAGRNYSESVWGNVDALARELPDIIGGAITSGQSYQKTVRILKDRFSVATWKATRLVRTETNYFNNQAELQSYIDDGFTQYEFTAILDGRTSRICREHDGIVYDIKDIVIGVNYPPLHPNCRSTTVVIMDSDRIKSGTNSRTGRLVKAKTGDEVMANYVNEISFS
jgi:SPP1 gp7 family putative phage head morphogenesis protein